MSRRRLRAATASPDAHAHSPIALSRNLVHRAAATLRPPLWHEATDLLLDRFGAGPSCDMIHQLTRKAYPSCWSAA
jgi:hypothetical protein